MSKPILELKLQISYDLDGDSLKAMKLRLQDVVDNAMGRGIVTGDGPATVDEYRVDITELPKFTI